MKQQTQSFAGTPHPGTQGFTLLELVIAITILAFLTTFSAQSIQTALRNKTKMQLEMDQMSALRAALRVMENDVQKAFNYRDMNILLHNRAAEERKKAITSGQPTPPGTPPPPGGAPPPPPPAPGTPPTGPGQTALPEIPPRNEVILTHFLGGESELHFTSLSYVRTTSESRMSDQCEVGYYIKDCRLRSDTSKSSNCLYRRSSPVIDLKVDEGGAEVPILEHVRELKLRYLAPGLTPEWLSSWYSNRADDVRSSGNFPLAVEITLEVEDPGQKKPLRMTSVAAVRNPNNPPPRPGAEGTNQVQRQ